MQEECSFQHLKVQYEFGFRNETVLGVKVMSYKLLQNANFKNGGTSIQIALLLRVNESSGYFGIRKDFRF